MKNAISTALHEAAGNRAFYMTSIREQGEEAAKKRPYPLSLIPNH